MDMKSGQLGNIMGKTRAVAVGLTMAVGLAVCSPTAFGHEVKDLKYGAVLFEFYQQKYFETLVEYDYAAARGGIHNHGNYPELLKGGVSLSYGLDLQAKEIFSKLIAEQTSEEVRNRAWYYLAKMLYLRGDVDRAAATLANIRGAMPHDIDQEYRYLAALINIKLGYFDEAKSISRSFDDDSPYAPFLYFNLGVAFGKQKHYTRAVADLKRAAAYADGSDELDRLADRAHMAMAYLYAAEKDFPDASAEIGQVSTTGVFSNRALLGSGWASVNSGSYREALVPLSVLEQRSIAIPEVQEAVLLVPHVYEQLGLPGRAAEGFIDAYDRYGSALEQLNRAKETLKDADVLELFVRNLDQMLGESDWFGAAPSASLNALSPFLLELMSDHSFQSVLKDLRDLYAIRNNLNSWKRKQGDFEVIIESRSALLDVKRRKEAISTYSKQQAELQARYRALTQRAAALGEEDRKRIQWLLSDIQFEINSAKMMVQQMQDAPDIAMNTDSYALRVTDNMDALDKELKRTDELIHKIEDVLLELVNAELDIHEERLKYYRVQAQLAKVRILDRSLVDLNEPAARQERNGSVNRETPAASGEHKIDAQGDADAF
jgi:tetratricopeptide (TPR) repeat protein